ncbi:hypothetical protein AX17_000519 [Amanita inopinata Kibby_2008]|nr:hypothetical protein AX17_000519 [Amanita inopinata Kibby_2008]
MDNKGGSLVLESPADEPLPSSSDTDDLNNFVSEPITPFTQSGNTSPVIADNEPLPVEPAASTSQKKKKKKKSKKSAKAREAAANKAKTQEVPDADGKPPVLCISRNKHWRYISSYHGPWLQLPLELLDSLLRLNSDPATLVSAETRMQSIPLPVPMIKPRDRGFFSLGENHSPIDSPRFSYSSLPMPPSLPLPKHGKPTPPPIDPGVFHSVTSIRRLIDEAAELSVRASSGLSAAELGSMRSGSGLGNSPWATAQSLGLNALGNTGGGRNVAMSAMRIHRLRALAVQKLAQAYKADEIASSVMVMQGGSVFDDVAERVLKAEPADIDARYVHFFHEKIPSRQLAESTTTKVLDELIAAQPQRLEFYRTRGIVHCFRDEYPQATKDFTHALKEARAIRRAKSMHRNNANNQSETRPGKNRKRKGCVAKNGQAPPDGTGPIENGEDNPDGEQLKLHPSVLPDAPDPIEPQLSFLRGAAYLQQAVFMIESAILELEGVSKIPSIDGAELRLCAIENGRYGGVEIGNVDGPLGKRNGEKLREYRKVLAEPEFREQITNLLKKSIRDHEKFLSHFDSLESPGAIPDGDTAQQAEYAFLLSESIRPGNQAHPPPPSPDAPAIFTTYHPLLVESHFSVLICHVMLADFATVLPLFVRTAALVDGLEGYPVFLPPRSMGQAEFVEVLERLASGWRNGIMPHSLSSQRGKGRLAIEAPPLLTPSPSMDEDRAQGWSSPLRASHGEGSSSSVIQQVDSGNSSQSPDRERGSTGSNTPIEIPLRPDAAEALDCARILLAPVARRQKERNEKVVAEKVAAGAVGSVAGTSANGNGAGGAVVAVGGGGGGGGGKKKPVPINIPLHGPRVEIVLAWLAAVHLPEMDGA